MLQSDSECCPKQSCILLPPLTPAGYHTEQYSIVCVNWCNTTVYLRYIHIIQLGPQCYCHHTYSLFIISRGSRRMERITVVQILSNRSCLFQSGNVAQIRRRINTVHRVSLKPFHKEWPGPHIFFKGFSIFPIHL